jgi:hypothetical protein
MLVGLSSVALISQAWAEARPVDTAPPRGAFEFFVVTILSNPNCFVSVLILAVGVLALVLQFRALQKLQSQPNDILRAGALTLIITFSLSLASFLTTEALKEASPIFGLFSTIAGYLLGSAQRQREPDSRTDEKASGSQTDRSASNAPTTGPPHV